MQHGVFQHFLYHLLHTTNHRLTYDFLTDVHDSCDFQTVPCPNSGYVKNRVVPNMSQKLVYSVFFQ